MHCIDTGEGSASTLRQDMQGQFIKCTVQLLMAASCVTICFASSAQSSSIEVPFERSTLANGLEVILHQDVSLPLVAVNIWYHVGPVNEPKGRSGFAHLFEHLMFEGSRHVGHQFDQLLESAGATNSNGTTSWDRTNYFETVPREHLETVLWLESDRMGFLLDAVDQAALNTQRAVVLNERRQSFANAPYGTSTLELLNAIFPSGHPYHGAVIGSERDLKEATLPEIRQFYREYYAPNNATLVIAGDFDRQLALGWAQRYFGNLKSGPLPQAPKAEPVLPPPSTRRLVIEEPVQLSQIAFGWACPPAYSASDPELQILAAILTSGRTSRLYRELVVDRKLATEVEAWSDSNALATLFVVTAKANDVLQTQQLETELRAAIERIADTGPTDKELARAKRKLLLQLYQDLQHLDGPGGESGRAGLLQRFNHYLGTPAALSTWPAQLERVDAKSIQAVVHRCLNRDKQTTVVTVPRSEESAR